MGNRIMTVKYTIMRLGNSCMKKVSKTIGLFLIVFFCMFQLIACNNGSKIEIDMLEIVVSPEDKTIIDLATSVYSEDELLSILNRNYNLEELRQCYKIDCIRKQGEIYRVAFLGNDCYLVIYYDSLGNNIFSSIYQMTVINDNLDNLSLGQKLADVQVLDPNGIYLFLYTGRNDIPRESQHYTNDGYYYSITYDFNNTIIAIKRELI